MSATSDQTGASAETGPTAVTGTTAAGATPDAGLACLQANLAAIRERDPLLAERVTLPVADDHVRVEGGVLRYRHRRAWYDLGLDGAAVDAALAHVPAAPSSLFLFGLGVGELLVAAARRFDGATITAWERDPFLLRLVLMQIDCAAVIRAGRLRFALLGDLMDQAGTAPADRLVVHPFLGRVYRDELRVLRAGPGPRRALVCAGELFVDDVTDALVADGFDPLTLDTGLLSVEELRLLVDRVRPRIVVAVNYKEGLAEFCRERGVPLVSWEIDPNTDGIAPVSGPPGRAHVFTYREAQVAPFRRAGFASVSYLPLATNPARRRPVPLDDDERAFYEAPVSFVGDSLRASAARHRDRFISILAAAEDGADARATVERRLDAVLGAQAADFATWRLPALLADAFPDLRAAWLAAGSAEDPVMLAGEVAAAAKRRDHVAALAPFGVHVWGDDGWTDLPEGARYRGPARHGHDLTRIYGATRVNVDIGRLYQSDIVPMRVFDILACGGFLLVEHSDALAALFEDGEELVSWRDRDDLVDKVRWYLAHPDEAARIAVRGRERVLRDHTIAARVREMLAAAGVA